jgi:hypothetical protein
MRARASFLFAFGIVALASLAPDPGGAQEGSVPVQLAGTWVADGGATRAMSIIDAAFAPGIEGLPYLLQGIARDRIHTSMRPPSRVVVTLSGAHLRVVYTSDIATKVIDGVLGAQASVSGLEEGTTVATALRVGWLFLSYEGEGGMTQLLSTEPDGSRMHVDSTVTSERLPAPVRWRLDYVRAGS